MKFQHHAAASVTISAILYLLFKSSGVSLGCLIAGICIDLDYVIDYTNQYGFPITVKKFFHAYNSNQLMSVRIFHGWEWLIFWGAAAWYSQWNEWIVGICLGFGQHLMLDKLYRGENLLSYSLIWRWRKGFRPEEIFRSKRAKKS